MSKWGAPNMFEDPFDPEREGVGEHDADLLDEDADDSFECPECGWLTWSDAEVCNGCGRAFTKQDRYGPTPTYRRFGRWYNFVLLMVLIVIIVLAVTSG